jgi:protein translocase SecG subunit
MKNLIEILQIFLGILIIALILLQQRGMSGGALFGFQSEFFFKKRGMEKYLFYLTWFFIALFALLSLLRIKFNVI